jgi:hypothetical protein
MFYPISQFIIFLNCLFIGFGILSPGVQVVFTFLLHLVLLGFFCIWMMYKNKLIFIFTVILQVLFVLVLLGFFMIYLDYKRDLTNSIGRERMGLFTIIMFFLFLFLAIILAIAWIVLRYCLPQKFKSTYYNKDFADEQYLKYYKEIPQVVFKMGQKAESQENTKVEYTADPYPPVNKPKSLIKPPPKYINSLNNNSIKTPNNNFAPHITPTDTLNPKTNDDTNRPMKVDNGDLVEKRMEYLSDDDNEINYNPNRSRAPNHFSDAISRDKKIAKLTLKNLDQNPYYQKDNFNTTDRQLADEIQSVPEKKDDIQVKESELFNSGTYYYKGPGKSDGTTPMIDTHNNNNLVQTNQTEIAKMDNFNFLNAYEVNKTTRHEQISNGDPTNIETSNKMNYSYFNQNQNKDINLTSLENKNKIEISGQLGGNMMQPDDEANKPFFTNENLTKIMGQDNENDNGHLYPDEAVEPMRNIQLKHSHFLMTERFDKAEDLK